MIADYIKLRPDRIGWTLLIYTESQVHEFTVGDVIQFTEETERTLGRWLADGPADFHGTNDRATLEREAYLAHVRSDDPENDPEVAAAFARLRDPDLARDLERGK